MLDLFQRVTQEENFNKELLDFVADKLNKNLNYKKISLRYYLLDIKKSFSKCKN